MYKFLLEFCQKLYKSSIYRPVAVHETKIVCSALKLYSFSFCKSVYMRMQFFHMKKKKSFLSLKYHQHTKVPQQS